MGLKDAKKSVVDCLKNGLIQHDTDRAGNIDEKNLLLTGQVTVKEVIKLVLKTKGNQYESSPHHDVAEVEVHIFKPTGWYIKCYFIDPNIFFISVHR